MPAGRAPVSEYDEMQELEAARERNDLDISDLRAMSVPVTVEAAAGGFVLPGDRVDVLTGHAARDADQGFTAEVVERNVRVLAVDQQTAPAAGAQSIVGRWLSRIPAGLNTKPCRASSGVSIRKA